MRKLGAPLVLALVLLAGVSRAGDERTVEIELKSGEKVTGRLVNFGEKRYKVAIGDQTLSLREEDVRRIEFRDARVPDAPSATAPVATSAVTAAQVVARIGDVKGLTREKDDPLAGGSDVAKTIEGGAGSKIEVLDVAVAAYSDRARAYVVVARFASVDDAARAMQRIRDSQESSRRRQQLLSSGALVALVADSGIMASSLDALGAATRAALADATGRAVESEPVETRAEFNVYRVVVPNAQLPEGIASLDVEALVGYLAQPVFGRCSNRAQRAIYHATAGGSVEVAVFVDPVQLTAPTIEEMQPYRYVWLGSGRAVALRVEGAVPEKTVQELVKLVRSEMAHSPDMAGARVLKALDAPSEPAKPAVALVDLVPSADELPPGFKIEEFCGPQRVQEHSWPFDIEESARAQLDLKERARVHAYLFRTSAPDAVTAIRSKLLESKEPAEILRADGFIVAIGEYGSDAPSLPGLAALRACFEKRLQALGLGSSVVERVRVLHERMSATALDWPPAALPAGFTRVGAEAASVTSYAAADQAWTVHYSNGAASVALSLLFRADSKPAGMPAPDELRSYRAAWVGASSSVAIATKGPVDDEALAAFVALVESELPRYDDTRDAKRLEIPKPKLIGAREVLPLADELPKALSVRSEGSQDAPEIQASVEAMSRSLTKGPLYSAMSAGERESAYISFDERHTLTVTAMSYESVAAATAAVPAIKRARSVFQPALREILQVENVLLLLSDEGATDGGWDSFRALIATTAGRHGVVQSVDVETAPALSWRDVVKIAPSSLPAGWEAYSPSVSVDTPLGDELGDFVYASYRGPRGAITLIAGTARNPHEPSRRQVRKFRHSWIFETRGVSIGLSVREAVSDDELAVFVRQIERDLARTTGARKVTHIDSSTLPTAEKPRAGEVYVYRFREKGRVRLGWAEILAAGPTGFTKRETQEGRDSTTTTDTYGDPDPVGPNETAVTVEISGVKIACAKTADGSVRPVERAFPFRIKEVAEDGVTKFELIAILPSVSRSLDGIDVGSSGKTTVVDSTPPYTVIDVVGVDSKAAKLGFTNGDRVLFIAKGVPGKKVVAVVTHEGHKPRSIELDD